MANISSGNRSASARTSRVTSIRLDPEDVDKTLAIWKSLSRELLQMKCNQYSLIATGSKKVLAKRLDDFVRARRDEEELRHIERCERDEQDAETPNTNEYVPPTEAQAPSLADLATQVKNLTEIVGHLVKKKGSLHRESGLYQGKPRIFLQIQILTLTTQVAPTIGWLL